MIDLPPSSRTAGSAAGRVLALALGPWEPGLASTLVRLHPRPEDRFILVIPANEGPMRGSVEGSASEATYLIEALWGDVDVSEVVVEPQNFEEAVLDLVRAFEGARSRGARVYAIPGSSPLTSAALLLAAALCGGVIALGGAGSVHLTLVDLPPLVPDVGEEKVAILNLLGSGATPREAAERLGVNPSTVYRHISALREAGLLTPDRRVSLVGMAVLVRAARFAKGQRVEA